MNEPDSTEGDVGKEFARKLYEMYWASTIEDAAAGRLTPDQARAVELRTACLDIAGYFEAINEDPNLSYEDKAALYIRYTKGYETLDRLGITPTALIEIPTIEKVTPLLFAERVGGQWQEMRLLEQRASGAKALVDQEMSNSHRGGAPSTQDSLRTTQRQVVVNTKKSLAAQLGTPTPAT